MIISGDGKYVIWRRFKVPYDSPSHTIASMELKNLDYDASDLSQCDSVSIDTSLLETSTE